jgi:hypothetical protein
MSAPTRLTPEQRATRGIRGWTRAYSSTGEGRNYLLKNIPARLYIRARAKARGEGISMRELFMRLLTDYATTPATHHEERNES